MLEKDYQLNVFLKYICIDFSMTCSSHFTDEEITLNYTDTYSLLLSIVTECDVFEVLRQLSIAHYLDQSVYAEGHPLKGKICTFKIGSADSGVRGLKVQDVRVLLLLSSQGEEQQQQILRLTVAYHKP